MVRKHREILNNRNAIFSLCEASCEAQFKPDVTSFFVGWCIYEIFTSLLPIVLRESIFPEAEI